MGKSRLKLVRKLLRPIAPLAVRLLQNRFFLLFVSLSLLGYVVGRVQLPRPAPIPYDELFDNMHVYSFRDTPSDTLSHFVVELGAGGRTFKQFDIDSRRFFKPERGNRYVRAISGTHYRPLRLRGHAGSGFWFEFPDSLSPITQSGQFDELYQRTLGYLRPVALVANALGVLSGYSIGFRIGTWEGSLANPRMQARLMTSPGIERLITLEAWRRVLLEPVLMGDEANADAFGSIQEKQRVYANFFRLALHDTNRFIPREAERLAQADEEQYSRAMLGFAAALARAQSDSFTIDSRDFRAIEVWAGMLYGRGHWAARVSRAQGDERSMYLGALAYYGLAPTGPDENRIWIGPRVLVKCGEVEGFVTDDIPATALGCPVSWRSRLMPDYSGEEGTPPETWARYGVIGSQIQPTLRALDRLVRRGRVPGRHVNPASQAPATAAPVRPSPAATAPATSSPPTAAPPASAPASPPAPNPSGGIL